MLKSIWLNLVLDVNFTTLNILKLEFYFVFFESIIYLKTSLQNFVEKHQFNVILSYFKQILESYLFNIIYLHTTCTVF